MLLHSNILGEGQPLIILHGFLGMSDNWKTLGRKFSQHNLQVHLLDQRNHGKSFHSDAFNYELLVEDLHNYITHYNLQNSIILGHSLGGKTAMHFAVKYAEMLSKLIIADISPRYYPPHHQTILEGLNALNFKTITSRNEADKALAVYIPTKSIRQFLLKNLYWKTKTELAFRMNLKALTANAERIGEAIASYAHFDKPTLFLKGDQSEYISNQDETLIKRHFPNATITEIKNAGHWLHAENPTDFFNTTLTFISQPTS